MTGEAVLLVLGVDDLTAVTFLSSRDAEAVGRVDAVLGTGALLVVVVGFALGAVVDFGPVGLVLVVVGVGLAGLEAVVEVAAETAVGLGLGLTSAFGTGGFDVADDGLDEGAAGFLVNGAVLLDVVVVGLEVADDLAAKGALAVVLLVEVVDLVVLGLPATSLAPGLLNGAFLGPV